MPTDAQNDDALSERSLADYRPQAENANGHTERGLYALERSIEEDGLIGAITVAADGETFDGSARIEKWTEMGFENPIIVETDGTRPIVHVRTDIPSASDPRARRLSIAANRVAELDLSWSSSLLKELNDQSLINDSLFTNAEIDALLSLPDQYTEQSAVENQKLENSERVYQLDEIADEATTFFRAKGFPYYKLPIHLCKQEINRLATIESSRLARTDIAYHVADTYHPHRFHSSAENMKAPFDSFNDDKMLRRAIMLALDNDEIVGEKFFGPLNLVSGTQACANFRPGFACLMYRTFCAAKGIISATVLDTSSGYGGRLVGAIASRCVNTYIGIDPASDTHSANLKLASDLAPSDFHAELLMLPAEDVDPSTLVNTCDFAFTSPPYFRKEHYSDEETQSYMRYPTGDAWRYGFLLPMMKLQYAALKNDRYAVVNIADVNIGSTHYPLVNWCISAAKEVGFDYVSTLDYELTANRLGSNHEEDDRIVSESVLVFKKA